MFVVFRDEFRDEADVCDTLEEVRQLLQERFDENPDYFQNYLIDQYQVRAIGEAQALSFIPAKLTIGPVRDDIPAPLPGETVTDYARRITGG